MTDKTQSAKAQLEALRAAYALTLSEKLSSLKAMADLAVAGNNVADDAKALADLMSSAHKLAGSAGTYGFPDLGTAAKKLELFCQPICEQKSPLTANQREEITNLVVRVINSHADGAAGQKSQDLLTPHILQSGLNDNKRILLVEDDPDQSMRLKIGLGAFGYEVKVIDNREGISGAIKDFHPIAILLDLELNGERSAGAEAIEEIRLSTPLDCAVIALTSHDDFIDRLATVKAGCAAFLKKPISLSKIIQLVASLTEADGKESERILVIDDDPRILEIVSAILTSQGMIVSTLSNPSLTLEVIKDFGPELILIDLSMPQCSGKQLSTMIRQIPRYMTIPIVFLSATTDEGIQLDAMTTGADDFLTKPFTPNYLVSAVRSRISRFRILRNLITRDALTCVYNHSIIWELFESELARADRTNAPVSFAILDIDHLKFINDTYGHRVGDIVLKALSKILKHRLRKSDIIGRLGGEEFGVILPNTTVDKAFGVLDTIRQAFTEISEQVTGSVNSVSFCCGIAAWPEYLTAKEMASAAEVALYKAKSQGRNNIVLASDPNSDTKIYQETSIKQAVSGKTKPFASSTQPTLAASSYAKQVIVLDDDPSIGEFIKPFAESVGFTVTLISDPALFASAYRADTELIMLDLNMPDIDGIEILRFLSKNDCNAAIVIISAYDEEILSAARNLAKRQGLNIIDVLPKPFDPTELLTLLEYAYSSADKSLRRKNYNSDSGLPSVEDLREAIDKDLLDVHYQPKIFLENQSIIGAEALVRWQHPKSGFVSPEYFVGMAEDNDLIDSLTVMVLRKACSCVKLLRELGHPIRISINLSDRSFGNLKFPEKISEVVAEESLTSKDFILELTETSLSTDTTLVIDVLTRLRMRGFEISIDDFGTGHSSLSRLNDLPFNELKIDKSFIAASSNEKAARAIVKNTINLARSLGLKSVGEGAETQADIDMLTEFGCDIVQGYFFSKPLPLNMFETWLKEHDLNKKVSGV